MSFDQDDEILQDFLIEAGEIIELLSEQLVDLEQRPDDFDLLNAIFRGFHTVKGGAGFLQLDPLVELCHVAENVFDLLRNSKLAVNPELMDVVLQALDTVNAMFGQVHSKEALTPAPPEVIKGLENLVDAGNGVVPQTDEAPAADSPPETSAVADEPAMTDADVGKLLNAAKDIVADDEGEDLFGLSDDDDATADKDEASDDLFDMSDDVGETTDEITSDELTALLGDEASESTESPAEPSVKSPDDASKELITDDEFESLLDELHGKQVDKSADVAPADNQTEQAAPLDNKISDSEFDSLLDDLYGAGKGPTVAAKPVEVEAVADAVKSVVEQSVKAAPNSNAESSAPASENKPPAPAPAPVAKAKAAAKGAKAGSTKDSPVVAETTVRVDTKRLDDIMNMVGELVLVRNRLVRLGLLSDEEEMVKAVANLDVVTADIQMAVMQTRMQPIKKVFGRFPRVVRDLARNLKKEIKLDLIGEDTDLDKNLVEALADPLVHLVRNSVDHGIELPAARKAAGKDAQGNISLSAQQEGDHIILSIADDGAGMDPVFLKGKAVEKGLMDEEAAERLSDEEAFNLIFHPGFSTKEKISDVSGRGVGMDVVKTKIGQLNGTITIDSELGKGSLIAIKVPLTLAIMPTLMVRLGEQAFALPLVCVNEIFHLDLRRTNVVDGQEVVVVRGKAVPLFYLKRWLIPDFEGELLSDSPHVVIVTIGTTKIGLVVDSLIGQEEVVIKPLGAMLHGTPGMAGATITGDGSIAIILDVPSLLKRYT